MPIMTEEEIRAALDILWKEEVYRCVYCSHAFQVHRTNLSCTLCRCRGFKAVESRERAEQLLLAKLGLLPTKELGS
mgnify:CR=1 FL=1